MVGGDSQLLEGLSMLGGGIACIALPAITRIFPIQLNHKIIPVEFGQHGGGSNGLAAAIPSHHRLTRTRQTDWEIPTIHQDKIHLASKLGYRTGHGQQGSLTNIETINFGNGSQGDGMPALVLNEGKQGATLGEGQAFGVVQPGNGLRLAKNHRSRHHRSSQRTTSHFVHTTDEAETLVPEGLFVEKIRLRRNHSWSASCVFPGYG